MRLAIRNGWGLICWYGGAEHIRAAPQLIEPSCSESARELPLHIGRANVAGHEQASLKDRLGADNFKKSLEFHADNLP